MLKPALLHKGEQFSITCRAWIYLVSTVITRLGSLPLQSCSKIVLLLLAWGLKQENLGWLSKTVTKIQS